MEENQKNNQFVDSFENSFEDSVENLIENSLDNAFDKYDYADQMALMDIWYEQHYLDDWDDDWSDDYSITEEYYCYDTEFDEENSESKQNESKYEIRTDNFEEFIQKLTNEE